MKREEKNLLSRLKIIEGALQEFGEKTYAEGSLNNICTTNGISKGIIYHYFKDKDELYLICVKECFDKLTDYLSKEDMNLEGNVQKSLQNYFDTRLAFFNSNPVYLKIFYDAVTNPPQHLKEEIIQIKSRFNDFNLKYFERLLDSIELRDRISKQDAMEYFFFLQDSFNYYFNKRFNQQSDISQLIKDHEIKISKTLNIMLYGIIKGEK